MKHSTYYENDYVFGQMMLSLRASIGITQAELGKALGISRRSVADWEAGNKYPKAEHLKSFIGLVMEHKIFEAGQEEEAIRALWKAARQKVLLDEGWLSGLTKKNGGETKFQRRDRPQGRKRLPVPPTKFVGRSVEVAEIIQLLESGSSRLVTLIGPGGIGKTRLALQVGTLMMDRFADGVTFVGLASVGSTDQIVSTIGEAIEWEFNGHSDPKLYLLECLSQRHLLLILDNFEHLLSDVHLVSDILMYAPDITILATSRERLNLQAEWLFDVEGLSYPTENVILEDLTDLSGYSAIELFVQRAMQIQPRFRLLQSNFMTILRICQQVAGMPLAIELAAASVRVLTVFQIETQLRSNLDALAANLHDMPPRHRSMRAAFDQSWKLLNETERTLFRRLAAFRGGFTLEAVEQVAGATTQTLLTLIDKSLARQVVTQEELNAYSDLHEVRFYLLEPIHEYALEKLSDSGELLAVQYNHARYYLSITETAKAQWYSPNPEREVKELRHDLDNLRVVLRWACDGGDLITGVQLGGALINFWRMLGYISEGRAWLNELLSKENYPSNAAAHSARVMALHTAAWLAADEHDFAQAEQFIQQRIALQRAAGEREDETALHTNRALQSRVVGDYQHSTSLLEEALEQYRAEGNRGTLSTGGFGFALYLLALVMREQGNFGYAERLFEECVDFHEEIGERTGVAQGLLGLSDVARDQGDIVKTRAYGKQSLAILHEFRMQWAIGFALNNLAQAALMEGNLKEAFNFADESVSLFRSLQADGSLAEVLVTLGHILSAQGKLRAAQTALTEALRLAWIVGPRLMMVNGLEALAQVMAHSDQQTLAVQALSVASKWRLQMGTPMRPVDRPMVEQTLATLRSSLKTNVFEDMWVKVDEHSLEAILSL